MIKANFNENSAEIVGKKVHLNVIMEHFSFEMQHLLE